MIKNNVIKIILIGSVIAILIYFILALKGLNKRCEPFDLSRIQEYNVDFYRDYIYSNGHDSIDLNLTELYQSNYSEAYMVCDPQLRLYWKDSTNMIDFTCVFYYDLEQPTKIRYRFDSFRIDMNLDSFVNKYSHTRERSVYFENEIQRADTIIINEFEGFLIEDFTDKFGVTWHLVSKKEPISFRKNE